MKAVITDYQYESIETERSIIEGAGFTLEGYQAKETKDLIPAVEDAQAVITQYADINAEVISHMKRARMIIKYGIGVTISTAKPRQKKEFMYATYPTMGWRRYPITP